MKINREHMPTEAKFIPKFLEIYANWFKYPPFFIRKEENNVLIYRFKGVNPKLELCVRNDNDCGIVYKDIPDDCSLYTTNLWEMSCFPEYEEERGFYCELCLPEYRKYYQDLESLYLEHTFKPLVEWCNKNFSHLNRLYIYHRKRIFSVYLNPAEWISKEEDISEYKIEPVLME
jgi:hypothetical protein